MVVSVSQVNGNAFCKNVIPNGVSINGTAEPLKHRSSSEPKVNGVYGKHDKSKPEKPERKLNSKELIEKQRNWTSHFSKAKVVPGKR